MNTIVPSQDAAIFAGPLPTFGAFEHYGCTECAHHVIAPSELHDVDYCPSLGHSLGLGPYRFRLHAAPS